VANHQMKDWEIIADNLSKAGWSWGCVSALDSDADGRFVIEVPQQGAFVIGAQAKRSVGNSTEHYYWLQPVSLEGQQKFGQNLSNNNLTSTTGTSSLIHTKD
jgi:hypothetical protein